ncbi:putative ABC transporter ATP-binding protein/permease [Cotonvirus japonicus]|uniref:ABC transporter ATP-binding protein/permease n=1 Tax=Cotonvirus japonicus TaxID=2811091 RepID=A0ABM7NRQ2_9VIRU|nr:putative ABC transporter ATP-binding protein/permease [Cotonvirus japonicus]BCS82843.1 putative ABC transporter ATP-binding protein/permease [Cotonvirus japonicus]
MDFYNLAINNIPKKLCIHLTINAIILSIIIPSITNTITKNISQENLFNITSLTILLAFTELYTSYHKRYYLDHYKIDYQNNIHLAIESQINSSIRKLPLNKSRTLLSKLDINKSKNGIIFCAIAMIDIVISQASYVFAFVGYTIWILIQSPINLVFYIIIISIIISIIWFTPGNIFKKKIISCNNIWEKYRFLHANQFNSLIHYQGEIVHDKMINCIREYETINTNCKLRDSEIVEFIGSMFNLASKINLMISLWQLPTIVNCIIHIQYCTIVKSTSNSMCCFYKKYLEFIFECEKISTVINSKTEINNFDQIIDFSTININDLYYEYSDNKFSLKLNRQIEIKQGQIIALVGKSGSGKSSFMDIVSGIIPCQEYHHEIFIDGIINDNSFEAVTQSRIYAEQFALHNWNATITELIVGNNNIHFSLICQALQIACCEDFISINDPKCRFNLESNCMNLSGGQKGRIMIAKIVYEILICKPKLLLLDEIDKSLNTDLALNVIKKILNLCIKNKIACIIVAHNNEINNLSFDNVLHFDNGIIN